MTTAAPHRYLDDVIRDHGLSPAQAELAIQLGLGALLQLRNHIQGQIAIDDESRCRAIDEIILDRP